MKYIISILLLFVLVVSVQPSIASTAPTPSDAQLALDKLVGEQLRYRVSFLWFSKIALGEISLQSGEKPGTYLATLKAETKGLTAFFTRDRVETFTTLMEVGPNGLLRPIAQTSDTHKGKNSNVETRQTTYSYDFDKRKVGYTKTVNGTKEMDIEMPMPEGRDIYDFLTAFYNLRLGRFGTAEPDRDIAVTAFSRKGPEKIVITRVTGKIQRKLRFDSDNILCRVVLDPETFKTKGKEVYVGFDGQWRPQRAVIPNVVGMGDVKGVLYEAIEPGRNRG